MNHIIETRYIVASVGELEEGELEAWRYIEQCSFHYRDLITARRARSIKRFFSVKCRLNKYFDWVCK